MTLQASDSEAAFAAAYGCDRLTAAVLANKFRYIVRHISTGIGTNAFSLILRDYFDFAATVSASARLDYAMPAVSNSLMVFLGTMTDAVRNTVEEWGADRLQQGDVLICNDPYRTGTHVNDVCFVRPVFHPTSDGPIAFVNIQAHMLDMGGVVPAGFSATKRNVYETGLVLSPRLLYAQDHPEWPTWSVIFDNARYGDRMVHDFKVLYQNLVLGERLLMEAVDEYGAAAVEGAIRYSCDVSAEAMTRALEALPDGDYSAEEVVDADGAGDDEEYKVKVEIRIRQGKAEVDLSGTSRQARTCINAGWLDTKTAVGAALKFLVDPKSEVTSGLFRPIDILLPEGTILSARPPDGAIFLYWESSCALFLAIFKALAVALGPRAVAGDFGSQSIHNANGRTDETGEEWLTMAQCGGEHGPWGATEVGDADSFNVVYLSNNMMPATEAIEADVPVVIMRKEYVPDTCGGGQHRGGAALVKDTLWLTDGDHYSMPLHFKTPSGFGVYGGRAGRTGGIWLWETGVPGDGRYLPPPEVTDYRTAAVVAGRVNTATGAADERGEYVYFARRPLEHIAPGAVFRYITNGGGGWGDPSRRDPAKVLCDVRDGYISAQEALEQYGVVIEGDADRDPEGLAIVPSVGDGGVGSSD